MPKEHIMKMIIIPGMNRQKTEAVYIMAGSGRYPVGRWWP